MLIRTKLVEQRLWPTQEKLRNVRSQVESILITRLEEDDSEISKGSFIRPMSLYIDKMSKEARQWKSGVRRLFDEGIYILDNENKPVGCFNIWEIMEDGYEYLYNYLLDESPIGSVPKGFRGVIDDCDVCWNEETLAEMLIADDLVETLLVITSLMENFSNPISLEDYRAILEILNWDYEKDISGEEFEGKLNEYVEHGTELLKKVSSVL